MCISSETCRCRLPLPSAEQSKSLLMQYIFPRLRTHSFRSRGIFLPCAFELLQWPPLKAATATNTLPTVKIFSDFVVFFIEIKTTIDNQAFARKFWRFRVTRHNDFPLKTKPIKPFVPVSRTQVLCPLWGEGM